MSSSVLVAYTHDHLLANRSGYHVLASYLDAEQVVAPRRDPSGSVALFGTRVLRRLAFSRWYAGGSITMERAIWQRSRQDFEGPVHLLWCDRDMGFIDLLLNASRNPLIGTFHQCEDDLAHVIRRPSALKKFAATILMSESQRPYFRSHGVPDSRLHKILHGVDTNHFTPGTASQAEAFTVLSVGGTRRDFALLREVAIATQSDRAMRFSIVGPTDKAQLFAGLPNVRYSPRLSDEALLDHYRSASCFLHLAENATANNAMLEALACGLPVVSQRVGGIPEYLNEECAILCPLDDLPTVVAALRSLAGSPSRQREASQAARSHALTLDWRIVARQTQQLYQSLS